MGVVVLVFARYSCIVLVVLVATAGTTVRSDTNIDSGAIQIQWVAQLIQAKRR